MGSVVDLHLYAQRRESRAHDARSQPGEVAEERAMLFVDGEPYLAAVNEVEGLKAGDVIDFGSLAVVRRLVAFRDGRICVHATRKLAYGRLRLVEC